MTDIAAEREPERARLAAHLEELERRLAHLENERNNALFMLADYERETRRLTQEAARQEGSTNK